MARMLANAETRQIIEFRSFEAFEIALPLSEVSACSENWSNDNPPNKSSLDWGQHSAVVGILAS